MQSGLFLTAMLEPWTLAELLCARLCHDLAGPVGAAAAGAELVEESGTACDSQTLGLVSASAATAVARLKFLRGALGPASMSRQSADTLRTLISDYLCTAGIPISLDWSLNIADVNGEQARLLLNLILLARDGLPRGGTILVKPLVPEGIGVAAHGKDAGLSAEVRAALSGVTQITTPKAAQACLVRHMMESQKAEISCVSDAEGFALTARCA